jgi:hypothetical protein
MRVLLPAWAESAFDSSSLAFLYSGISKGVSGVSEQPLPEKLHGSLVAPEELNDPVGKACRVVVLLVGSRD